jgi:hypothetical protein
MTGFHSFYWLNSMWTKFSLSSYQLMDTYIISISYSSWIVLPWTWKCRCLFHTLISFSLSTYPEVGFLDHVVAVFFIFEETPSCYA